MDASPKPAPLLTLRLSGTAQAVAANGTVHELGTIDALMLAWLAIQGPTPRERMAALLWPESGTEVARNALRQRLFRLRRQCGVEAVAGTQQLALAAGVAHDLADAPLLLGTLTAPEGEMALWLQAERERRRDRRMQALAERIDALEAAREPAAALPLATELIELDPLAESAHRRLMRLHYLAGDRAAALRAFDRCEQWLKHELGARPSRETLALLQALESPDPGAAPAPPACQLPAELMRPPRLVGRAEELGLILRSWQGAGRVVVLGDAGMGKSRLLSALLAERDGPLHAAARPGDDLAPYAALARALRELARRAPQWLRPDWHQALAPVLPELAAGTAPPLHGGSLRDELLAALALWLDQAAPVYGGLILDDLHFADTATLQLLPDLLARTSRMAWVLALRPPLPATPQQALVDALAADGRSQQLTLQPLARQPLCELVDCLGLPRVRGEALADALLERSGGNPLFALETLKQAWLQHRFEPGPGHSVEALPRPASVQQLIARSLAALSPPALLLARVAAIAGADFSIELASHVLQQGPLQLADAWAELEARQVLRGSAFAHDLVHECVLAAVPQVLARHTHATVAAWLEGHDGEPARTAAHWEAAGQPRRALPSLREAADRAQAALRVSERIAFLLRGADIAEADGQADDAFGFVDQALDAHMNTVRHAAGVPLMERLDRLASTPLQRLRALDRRAWYAANLGQWNDAIVAGEAALHQLEALEAAAQGWPTLAPEDGGTSADAESMRAAQGPADESERAELRASIVQRLGTSLAMVARFDEALPLLRSVESWMARHGDSALASEYHGNLAAVLDNLGRPAEAAAHHRQNISAARAAGDHASLVTALANHAVSLFDVGQVPLAQAQLESAQQLAVRYGLKGSSAAFVIMLLAQAARAEGHWAAALRWCDEAEPMLQRSNPAWLPTVALQRAHVLLDVGQWARAGQLLAGLDASSLRFRWRTRLGILLARLRQALGDPAGAQAALAQAQAALPEGGWPELSLALRIEQAAGLAPKPAEAALRLVADAAQRSGLAGTALAARLRLAQGPLAKAKAQALVREIEAADSGLRPNHLSRLECWLGLACAQASAGQALAAASTAAAGLAWLDARLGHDVPPAWHDALTQRHPVVQRLRQLAAHATQD